MKEYLPIETIDNNIITLKDRKGRKQRISILKATPLNFKIRNELEKNAIT